MKKLKVKCPKCSKEFNYHESEARPFCREKCKLLDLGQWLDEGYAVPGRDNSVYIEDSEQLQHLLDESDESY